MNFSDEWYANMMAEARARKEETLAGYDVERGRADMEQVRQALDDEGIPWWEQAGPTYGDTYMITCFEMPERGKEWCMTVSNGPAYAGDDKIPLGTVEVELFYDEDDRGRAFMGIDDFVSKVRDHDWEL